MNIFVFGIVVTVLAVLGLVIFKETFGYNEEE